MTLSAARSSAKTALDDAFKGRRPKVYVDVHAGAMDKEGIQRRFNAMPAVLVTVLGRTDDGIRLAVYVLGRPRTEDLLPILDTVEETLRALPGAQRAPLAVQTQCLYDGAIATLGATLWAVITTWPPLASGAPPAVETGLIKAANTFFAGALTGSVPGGAEAWRFGYTEPERRRLMYSGQLPFVTVAHGNGTVTSKGSYAYKYQDDQKNLWERKSRGVRSWPVTVEFWGRSEAEADAAILAFLNSLPGEWTYLEKSQPVKVRRMSAEYKEAYGAYAAGAEVEMIGVLAGEPVRVPVIRSVDIT